MPILTRSSLYCPSCCSFAITLCISLLLDIHTAAAANPDPSAPTVSSSPAPPLGSKDDPLFTDQVPVSPGVALVIGSAGAAIVLSQSVIRSWRRVSLGQFRGLLQAKIPLLVAVLVATSIVGAVGAFVLFDDDEKALASLFPLIGVFAPFVFLARRPCDDSAAQPTQSRILGWIRESPVNIAFMAPAAVLSALCSWGMISGRSWDVLAISFSIAVAVLTRSDPVLYMAWDGRGPKWQWGRLVPSPVRMPSWRLVVGRVESAEDDQVEVMADAMEVPVTDTAALKGGLWGETPVLSDQALAGFIAERGVLAAMPMFYEYVRNVWTDIIHTVSKGTVKEGRELDTAAASFVLLVFSLLRDSLATSRRTGADVWLLLAIFRLRMDSIATDYISLSSFVTLSPLGRLRMYWSDLLSSCLGREVGARYEGALTDQDLGVLADNVDSEDECGGGDADRQSCAESGYQSGDEETPVSSEQSGRHVLRMFHALSSADKLPEMPDPQNLAAWVLEVLGNLYRGATATSKQEWNRVGKKQAQSLPSSLSDFLGKEETAILEEDLLEMFSSVVDAKRRPQSYVLRPVHDQGDAAGSAISLEAGDENQTVAEETNGRLADEEAFTYVMLTAASREIVSSTSGLAGGYVFESSGIDIASGELNGRLTAQSMAHKVMLAQFGVWAYVAIGQTATALLSRN